MNDVIHVTPNQTGVEMLIALDVLDAHLASPGLTSDALGTLQARRGELSERFEQGANYAALLATATSVEFPNALAVYDDLYSRDLPEHATGASAEQEKPNIWGSLSAEQKQYAESARTALSVEFQRHVGEFDLIKTENPEDPAKAQILLALTATQRLDLGDPALSYDPKRSWYGIMGARNNPERRVIIDGKRTDVYATQTLAVLNAIAKANPEINEWVWCTGEPERADFDYGPVVHLSGGRASVSQNSRGSGSAALGFRPAVVIVG